MLAVSIAIAAMKIAAAKLSGFNTAMVLSFIGGAAVTLGLSHLGGSTSPAHVYEVRLYHVNEGKMDALIARFGDHTDAIFKRHNMGPLYLILEHPSREEAKKNWAAFQADPEWKKVKADSETSGLANHGASSGCQ
jgi:hypothetical protein